MTERKRHHMICRVCRQVISGTSEELARHNCVIFTKRQKNKKAEKSGKGA